MKKKSSRTRTNHAAIPQPAQLDAVRKLSHTGRHEEAQTRVAALRARFPDFKPLMGLAWEVDDCAGHFLSASRHAWDWSMASPGSVAALEALRDSAFDAGLPALGASAALKLARAEGNPVPDLPPMPGALGDLPFDQAVAVDLSRLFLNFGRYSEAIAILEGIDHPSTRNNLAMARFAQGEIAAARAGFEANWQQDRRNLFALHYVVRLRLWSGGHGPANELAEALRDAQPLRAEDAYGKMFGLLLLGEDDDTVDAWDALCDAEFWGEESVRENSICAYFAGLAALRKGDMESAGALFSEALDLNPDNPDADTASMALALSPLGKEVDAKAGEFHDWFPQSWITEIRAAKGAHTQEAVLDAQHRRCDAHADYLAAAIELGGAAVRFYAVSTLQFRALDGDGAALDALRKLLTRPCGPDKVRMDLDVWLQENGFVEAGQPQRLLLHGEVRELVLRPTRLHAEPTDLGLPAASQARLEQMHRLLKHNDLPGALHIAEELAAAHAGHPTLVGNVANIMDALGYDLDETEALFQRAAELDPTYFFAQAGLARIAARKGDVERARELLKPLENRDEYHFSEWRALLMTEREIAAAQRDVTSMLRLDEALNSLMEQFG
jgi:tetratricopeptide (TPR) repeat protein